MRPSELKMYYASCRSACVPFNRLDPRYNAKLGNASLEHARFASYISLLVSFFLRSSIKKNFFFALKLKLHEHA